MSFHQPCACMISLDFLFVFQFKSKLLFVPKSRIGEFVNKIQYNVVFFQSKGIEVYVYSFS